MSGDANEEFCVAEGLGSAKGNDHDFIAILIDSSRDLAGGVLSPTSRCECRGFKDFISQPSGGATLVGEGPGGLVELD